MYSEDDEDETTRPGCFSMLKRTYMYDLKHKQQNVCREKQRKKNKEESFNFYLLFGMGSDGGG